MSDTSGGYASQGQQDPDPSTQAGAASQPAPPTPVEQHRLDPATTEVVLRRAFELARVEPTHDVVFSRSTLAEIAAEVDLPVHAVAAALAEQMADGTADDSLLDRLVGSDRVTVHRMSTASEEVMRERAVRLLEVGHGMRPRVQIDGVVVATKRKDVLGKLAHTVRDVQGLGQLGKLRRVEVAAVDVGDEPGALVLSADIGDKRTNAILGGSAVGVVGSLVAAGVAVTLAPVAAVAVPVALGAGVVTSRVVHGSTQREAEEDLEAAADVIVAGEDPDGLIGRGAKRVLESLRRTRRRR